MNPSIFTWTTDRSCVPRWRGDAPKVSSPIAPGSWASPAPVSGLVAVIEAFDFGWYQQLRCAGTGCPVTGPENHQSVR